MALRSFPICLYREAISLQCQIMHVYAHQKCNIAVWSNAQYGCLLKLNMHVATL